MEDEGILRGKYKVRWLILINWIRRGKKEREENSQVGKNVGINFRNLVIAFPYTKVSGNEHSCQRA